MSALEYAREKFAGIARVNVIGCEGGEIVYARREKNPVPGKETLALPLSPEPEAEWANYAAIDSMYDMFVEVYPD